MAKRKNNTGYQTDSAIRKIGTGQHLSLNERINQRGEEARYTQSGRRNKSDVGAFGRAQNALVSHGKRQDADAKRYKRFANQARYLGVSVADVAGAPH